MKQILPKLKELNKHLNFAKKAFTKGGFRHATNYIDGIITLNKKTVKKISQASIEENHHSAISRILTEAKFEQEMLEERYLNKVAYLAKGLQVSLIFDDTLAEHNGECIEEAQSHYDHSIDDFIRGHQFFTSMIHTPVFNLPLFPRLYSKNTDSKIDMARDMVDYVVKKIKLYSVVFDSWYSDKKLIKKSMTKGIKVVCAIKANRTISIEKGKWKLLSDFLKTISTRKMENYLIDEKKYKILSLVVKLRGIPHVKLIICKEWDEEKKKWGNFVYFISTDKQDTPVQIIRHYKIRWSIETYHFDIKQNLGFAKAFFRKKGGIVRHAIFSTIAYAILKLFMLCRGLVMTIGECIGYIQDKEMDGFIREIVEIEDKSERIAAFEEVFIRKTAKV